MGRRGHDPVLRRRAIDLLESGKSVKEVAEELGVSDQSIYTWRRQYRIDSGQEPGLTTTEVNELNAARRQIKHLEGELAVHELATELLKGIINPKAGGRPSQWWSPEGIQFNGAVEYLTCRKAVFTRSAAESRRCAVCATYGSLMSLAKCTVMLVAFTGHGGCMRNLRRGWGSR